MRVTFDTNVWKRMVFPEGDRNNTNHAALVRIKKAVQSGLMRGFISESFGTVEAIPKKDRSKLHAQSFPKVEVTSKAQGNRNISLTIGIQADHSLHPGIGENFERELNEAVAIGMKLLSSPYVGVPIPAALLNNPHYYAQEVFATADYSERFASVVEAISARGVGGGRLAAIAKEFTERLDAPRPDHMSDRQLIYGVYEYACISNLKREKEQISKAFGESADGDVVAAHVAFGNDYLCTEDRGRSAIGPSIFDAENRAWLKSVHGVHIVSVQQLSDLLQGG